MKEPYTPKKLMKKSMGWLHLWLGLISGIVVLISMLGATVFVWEEELTAWYYGDIMYTDEVGTAILPTSTLYASVHEAYPDKEFTFVQISRDPHKNYAFRSFKSAKEKGWTWASGIEHYITVFVNPYTGEVVGQIDKKKDWITLSRFLHQYLLLKRGVGDLIVGIAALIMIILSLTGLYLWFPKTKKAIRQRLTIKWKAKFKRVNWDVHSVGGFYTYLFLILFATTGLTWTFDWWTDGIYWLMGSQRDELFQRPEAPQIADQTKPEAIDIAYSDATQRQPGWTKIYFNVPSKKREKGTISVGLMYPDVDSWWETKDYFYYHPETGAIHHTLTHDEKKLAEKWRHSNYAIHVGNIYGWPTKVIASICALFFATLPISGFLIWWGRRKKKKPSVRRKPTARSSSPPPAKAGERRPLKKASLKPVQKVPLEGKNDTSHT